MDNLARGATIVTEHLHVHHWAVWIAIFAGVWIPIGIGIGWWQNRDEKPDVEEFWPKPRMPIEGSEKDYRR
jgi:hypothetical protein